MDPFGDTVPGSIQVQSHYGGSGGKDGTVIRTKIYVQNVMSRDNVASVDDLCRRLKLSCQILYFLKIAFNVKDELSVEQNRRAEKRSKIKDQDRSRAICFLFSISFPIRFVTERIPRVLSCVARVA